MPDVVLQGDRCTIRPWRYADLGPLVAAANDVEVWRNLTDRFPHPYTSLDADRWLQHALVTPTRGINSAIAVDGVVVGGIGLDPRPPDDVERRTAEVGYWLGREHWGAGIATEAVEMVTHHALEVLGFHRIEARVFGWNAGSQRVLEKARFRLEGRLRDAVEKAGRLTDLLIYGRVSGDAATSFGRRDG